MTVINVQLRKFDSRKIQLNIIHVCSKLMAMVTWKRVILKIHCVAMSVVRVFDKLTITRARYLI